MNTTESLSTALTIALILFQPLTYRVTYVLLSLPQLFVASVLLEPELSLTPMPSPAHQSYGAMASAQSSGHCPADEDEQEQAKTHETELQDPPDPYYSSQLMDSPVGYQ